MKYTHETGVEVVEVFITAVDKKWRLRGYYNCADSLVTICMSYDFNQTYAYLKDDNGIVKPSTQLSSCVGDVYFVCETPKGKRVFNYVR